MVRLGTVATRLKQPSGIRLWLPFVAIIAFFVATNLAVTRASSAIKHGETRGIRVGSRGGAAGSAFVNELLALDAVARRG